MFESTSGLTLGLLVYTHVFVIGYIVFVTGVIYNLSTDTKPGESPHPFVYSTIGKDRKSLLRLQLGYPHIAIWIVSGVGFILGVYIPLAVVITTVGVVYIKHDSIISLFND